MKSAKSKVMHHIAGLPMLGHVLRALAGFDPDQVIVVLSPDQDDAAAMAPEVWKTAGGSAPLSIAHQADRLGTGHAVMQAMPQLKGFDGTIVVGFGDVPLITGDSMAKLAAAKQSGADVVVLGFQAADPYGYGRLITDSDGRLDRIVEEKDASAEERAVTLCNSGIMAFEAKALPGLLDALTNDNAQGEYYLTDAIAAANKAGLTCAVAECPEEETMGINSRVQLAEAEKIMQTRLRRQAMEGGVTLADPETVHLSWDTDLGQDVWVGQHVVFGPGVKVEDNVTIKPFSHLEQAHVRNGADIGPYARLRPGADIGEGARVGNFVEVKKTTLGKGAKANHLTYLGDATVGAGANVGAGTITCNYDGYDKFPTTIGERAFVGSNSTLVAPVKIADDGFTAAGSVITKDVGEFELGVGRAKQSAIKGWVQKFRASKDKK